MGSRLTHSIPAAGRGAGIKKMASISSGTLPAAGMAFLTERPASSTALALGGLECRPVRPTSPSVSWMARILLCPLDDRCQSFYCFGEFLANSRTRQNPLGEICFPLLLARRDLWPPKRWRVVPVTVTACGTRHAGQPLVARFFIPESKEPDLRRMVIHRKPGS
jgi:hypothetical protein